MSKKMKITIEIEGESGEILASRESSREVPYIEEVIEQGFRGAFHELETAVLESRKEVSDGIVSDYLEVISKKKPKLKREIEKSRQKGTE
jgi:hypothetical protein